MRVFSLSPSWVLGGASSVRRSSARRIVPEECPYRTPAMHRVSPTGGDRPLFPLRRGESGRRGRALSTHEPGVDDGLSELPEPVGGGTDEEPFVTRRASDLEDATRLQDDQPGGRVVPDVRPLLDVRVERPGGHAAQVEGARALPTDVAHAGQQPGDVRRLAG